MSLSIFNVLHNPIHAYKLPLDGTSSSSLDQAKRTAEMVLETFGFSPALPTPWWLCPPYELTELENYQTGLVRATIQQIGALTAFKLSEPMVVNEHQDLTAGNLYVGGVRPRMMINHTARIKLVDGRILWILAYIVTKFPVKPESLKDIHKLAHYINGRPIHSRRIYQHVLYWALRQKFIDRPQFNNKVNSLDYDTLRTLAIDFELSEYQPFYDQARMVIKGV